MNSAAVKGEASSPGSSLLQRRSAGVLLHPTSLPGPGGIGDFGPWCHRFLDFAAAAKASLWQVLPLGPTGYGGSPYQCTSSFATNPLLISLEWLRDHGLLGGDFLQRAIPSEAHILIEEATQLKEHCLAAAFERFRNPGSAEQWREGFSRFKDEQSFWLEDYALFAALKEEFDGSPWFEWPHGLVTRNAGALRDAGLRFGDRVEYRRFVQFVLSLQWSEIRAAARRRGILVMGDIPIFPAHDSADVWANQTIFRLDEKGLPTAVAGVPPDYFSETGQLWGNPVYRWDVIQENGFDWWVKRLGHMFSMVDIIRLDHFRGFMAAWEVPSGETTAVNGQWVPGPGRRVFQHLRDILGPLPIVAENLGVITPDVEAARQEFAFPGMNILEFAFDSDADNPHLPHNQGKDTVVYTGTHDNDTVVGWFACAGEGVRRYLQDYLDRREPRIPYDLIRLAYASAANTAIAPMQDILGLGGSARMNYPGKTEGNWRWRMTPEQMDDRHATPLADLARVFGRLPQGV